MPMATASPCSVANLVVARSEEHTSELQSRLHLVCRLLLEKKNACAISCSSTGNLRDRFPDTIAETPSDCFPDFVISIFRNFAHFIRRLLPLIAYLVPFSVC